MMKLRFIILSFLITGIFVLPQASRAAESSAPAAAFMQKMADAALLCLNSSKMSSAEKHEQLRALFRQGFDIKTIGRFVLGKHWKEATEDQRHEYLSLFEDRIVQTYEERLTLDPVKSFTILNVTPDGSGSQDSLVNSVIVRTSDPEPTKVTWRVRLKEGQMKIVDVLVDGISSSITQRSDFDSVIVNGGGKIETLLDTLRNLDKATQ